MLSHGVNHVVSATGLCASNSLSKLRDLATERQLCANHASCAADLYCQPFHYDWVKWKHALCLRVPVFRQRGSEFSTAVSQDVREEWHGCQSLCFEPSVDMLSMLEVVRRCWHCFGTWLSFRILIAQCAFNLFEHTFCNVTVHLYYLYSEFKKIVSYHVVPETWCCEVATLALL